MKYLNVFFIILFLSSAALQYNDPDPLIWMAIYLYGAVLCFFAFRRRYSLPLYLIGFVVYFCYSIFLFFAKDGVLSWILDRHTENLVQGMKATKPWIENAREFFGLLLLISALLANTFWLNRTRPGIKSSAKEKAA